MVELKSMGYPHVTLQNEHGLYKEGWNTHDNPMSPPHWKTAIFLIKPKTPSPPSMGEWEAPPTTGLVTLNPITVERVREACLDKGWGHIYDTLGDGMIRFANIMVTLRSGRKVEDQNTPDSASPTDSAPPQIPQTTQIEEGPDGPDLGEAREPAGHSAAEMDVPFVDNDSDEALPAPTCPDATQPLPLVQPGFGKKCCLSYLFFKPHKKPF